MHFYAKIAHFGPQVWKFGGGGTLIQVVIIILMINVSEFIIGYLLTLCLKHCPCLSYAKLLIVKIFLSTLLTYKNWKNDKKFSFNKLVFCRFLPHLRYCALGAPVLEKIFTIGQNRPFLAYQSYFIDLYWHYGAEGAVFIKIACLSGKICNFDAFLRENSPFWSSSLKIWGGGYPHPSSYNNIND